MQFAKTATLVLRQIRVETRVSSARGTDVRRPDSMKISSTERAGGAGRCLNALIFVIPCTGAVEQDSARRPTCETIQAWQGCRRSDAP